jgi:hypothetical protein
MNTPQYLAHAVLRRRRLVPVALAAVAMGTLGFASGAGAAPSPVVGGSGVISNAAGASTQLAGYQVAPSGGLASANVTFTVPTITCTSADKTDIADMFDGVFTADVDVDALVESYCTSTGTHTDFFVSTPGGSLTEPGPAPGDTVVASMFQSGTGTGANVHDVTSGAYWFEDDSANVGDTTIDIGSLNQFQLTNSPVPTFTKVHFSNATVNGDYLGFTGVGAAQFNDLNGGDLLIKSGALSTTGAGTTFADTFKHAS